MTEQAVYGEILRGHRGTYQTFVYPAETLTTDQVDQCLQHTRPGSLGQGNQVWRCGDFMGQPLLVSAYSAFYTNHLQADYCHAVYRSLSTGTLYKHVTDTIFFPFAGEDDILSVMDHRSAFEEGWHNSSSVGKQTGIWKLSPERLAELACCCLYNGIIHNLGQLVILIPEDEDYLSCCRTVMERILLCVPAGLRRHLSFATNADAAKKFVVLFAPHEAAPLPSQTVIPLYDVNRWPEEHLRDTSLPQALVNLIQEAAKDPSILDLVYSKIEEGRAQDSLTQDSYGLFWFQYTLENKNIDYILLQKYSAWIAQTDMTQREKNTISSELNSRLPRGKIEDILNEDPDINHLKSVEMLAITLEKYQAVMNLLHKKFDFTFSDQLLTYCMREIWETQSIEQWTKFKSSLKRCKETQILDSQAVKNCFTEIDRGINSINTIRQSRFITNLTQMLANQQYEQLKSKLNSLRSCREDVREICMSALLRKTAEYLNNPSWSDNDRRDFYEKIYDLLEDETQRKVLEDWYKEWQEQRERTLLSMTSFRAYFATGVSSREYTDCLWKNLEESGRKQGGIIDLIQAAEQVEKKVWPELMKPLSEQLQGFVENYQIGIWLDSEKQWGTLYSELLAYRRLMAERDNGSEPEVYMWSAGTTWPEAFKLQEVLETTDFILSVLAGAPENAGYSSDVLQYFLSAGMIPVDQFIKIKPCLLEQDVGLLEDETEASMANADDDERRNRRSIKELFAGFRPLLFKLIKLAAITAILCIIVTLLVLLFSGGGASDNSAGDGANPPPVYSTDDTSAP